MQASDIIYERVLSLCNKHGITINALEKALGFSTGSIGKWKRGSYPKANAVCVVAEYFNTTTDYLLGLTEISQTPQEIYGSDWQPELIQAYERLTEPDRQRLIEMVKIMFPDN